MEIIIERQYLLNLYDKGKGIVKEYLG